MTIRSCTTALLLLTLLCSSRVSAQAGNWYRVELLVFAQGGASAARQEHWDPQPALGYPADARFLVYPQRAEQRLAEHPGATSRFDESGRQVITLPEPEAPVEEAPIPVAEDIPRRQADTPVVDAGTLPGEEDELEAPLLPHPFVVRPASERQFGGKAAYMERHGDYRVLFHETWLQPMPSEGRAVPLVLDDSGASQHYPELQGSVKLYAKRYLHIETDLWLNTGGDYLSGDWQMPRPPLGPSSLVIEEPVSLPALENTTANNGFGVEAIAAAGAGEAAAEEDAEVAEAEPHYPFRHAVRLSQSRRMRSTEVHYIDHPMLGAVVVLTPLKEERLEQLATEDIASGRLAILEPPEDPNQPE